MTLLTRASYLPGVITLAHSLQLCKTAYPLIVLITPSLPHSCVRALELERLRNPLFIMYRTEPLLLPKSRKTALVASRFEDTWTKFRVFELTDWDQLAFLDADITIYKNMDELLHLHLPQDDWIAACHSCVCNLDHASWAPHNWTRKNCACTPLSHPASLSTATPTPSSSGPPHTHALLNGGVFVFRPSLDLLEDILDEFRTNPALAKYQFPDQDFLAAFFVHRWMPLSWRYNAIKTMQNWHPDIWRDDDVKALHYIVDKPWEKQVATDGVARYLGRDGLTHKWWWGVYHSWWNKRGGEVVDILDTLVAPELSDEANQRQCEENLAKGLPVAIPKDQDEDVFEHDANRQWSLEVPTVNGGDSLLSNGIESHMSAAEDLVSRGAMRLI